MDDVFKLTKKEVAEIAKLGFMDKPDLRPPAKEEMERIEAAQKELKCIAAAESEEERKRMLDAAINRTFLYRGEDKAGNVHEDRHMFGMKFKVVISTLGPLDKQHLLGGEIKGDPVVIEVNWCATGDQAMHVVKNVRAQGKTAEIIPMTRVVEDGSDVA